MPIPVLMTPSVNGDDVHGHHHHHYDDVSGDCVNDDDDDRPSHDDHI